MAKKRTKKSKSKCVHVPAHSRRWPHWPKKRKGSGGVS
jgi:hypothetical protein